MDTHTNTFEATGQSSTAYGGVCDAIISGTFVGTIKLEAEDPTGNWIEVGSWTDEIASLNNEAGFDRNWRLNCTDYTSGTINYELSAGKFRHLKTRNKSRRRYSQV